MKKYLILSIAISFFVFIPQFSHASIQFSEIQTNEPIAGGQGPNQLQLMEDFYTALYAGRNQESSPTNTVPQIEQYIPSEEQNTQEEGSTSSPERSTVTESVALPGSASESGSQGEIIVSDQRSTNLQASVFNTRNTSPLNQGFFLIPLILILLIVLYVRSRKHRQKSNGYRSVHRFHDPRRYPAQGYQNTAQMRA